MAAQSSRTRSSREKAAKVAVPGMDELLRPIGEISAGSSGGLKQPLKLEEPEANADEPARPFLDIPEKLRPLFTQRARYKVMYGGRGGAKSWSAARALLARGAVEPIRVLCAREHQTSIRDSVHRLLADQLAPMRLAPFYRVTADSIRGPNGTEFIFAGLRHNVGNIRSKEGIDVCWVEEAQAVSRHSWETLIPTIRKEGSEIWVTFNPELEEDDTWLRFVVRPPSSAWVTKVTLDDNEFCPQVLKDEAAELKARDPEAWAHIWNGECRAAVAGAVYAEALAKARDEGRITVVPYEPTAPVHCFWDLGWSDCVSIWMAQAVGLEFRIVDFLQASQKPIDWYVAELAKRDWVWGEDWLPHDAEAKTLAAAGRTIRSQLQNLGRKTRIVEKVGVADGINAARGLLGRCWFDEVRCADGLQALRHYRYAVDTDGRLGRTPLHDWSSHAADAFRYLAVSLEAHRPKARPVRRSGQALDWMG